MSAGAPGLVRRAPSPPGRPEAQNANVAFCSPREGGAFVGPREGAALGDPREGAGPGGRPLQPSSPTAVTRSLTATTAAPRASKARIWAREALDHYVEEPWVSRRLFEEERFDGAILDPACGFGHIVTSARACGLAAWGTDLAARAEGFIAGVDFLTYEWDAAVAGVGDAGHRALNIVCNPPFKLLRKFIERALALVGRPGKIAMIAPTRRLNAAGWLAATPLQRILYITPRPNMPPGWLYGQGARDGRAREDFCWLVLEPGRPYAGAAAWLHRDGGSR